MYIVLSLLKISESCIFVTINSTCPECCCGFDEKIIDKPQEANPVILECSLKIFDPTVNHTKKRPLQEKLREAVAKEIVERNLVSCQYRRNEAHQLIQKVGDVSPPNLFRKDTIRKARQEGITTSLDINSSNVFSSLLILKYCEKYEGSIRNIGIDPPFVYYWTKEQQLISEKFPGNLKVDGTGSITTKILFPNNERWPHIYLYQGVVEVNGKTVPVFQMLSSVQITVAILNFLLEFLRVGALENSKYPLPEEVRSISIKRYCVLLLELIVQDSVQENI